MYGRIILFILVTFYQVSAISGEFLQVYYHNGEFKEDLKIYGTGLVKLSTSSLSLPVETKVEISQKGFQSKRSKRYLISLKKSAEIHSIK